MCTLSQLLRHVQVSLAVDSKKKCSWASWKLTFDVCWELKSMLLMLWKSPVQIVYIWCHLGSGSIRSDCIQFYDGIWAIDDFARMGWVDSPQVLNSSWSLDGVSVQCMWLCFSQLLSGCWPNPRRSKMLYPGDSIRDLFGMVKTWPFEGVKWPPTRGWKGRFESPGWFFLIRIAELNKNTIET